MACSSNNSEMEFDSSISSEYEDVLNSTVSGHDNDTSEPENVTVPDSFKLFQDYLDKKLAHIDKLKKIDKLELLLSKNIKQHDQRLTNLESDNQKLQKQVQQLSKENKILTKELRNKNLIIHGLAETENESPDTLKVAVSDLFQSITQKNIAVDTVYRLGHKKDNVNRHVRVSLLSQTERNLVYENRLKTKKGIFVNEDLHPNTRKDHSLLRKKRKELSDQQIKSSINYSTSTLQSETGEIFCVRNGNVEPQNSKKDTNQSASSNSKNERPKKRKVQPLPDPHFMGKDNLRGKNPKLPRTET